MSNWKKYKLKVRSKTGRLMHTEMYVEDNIGLSLTDRMDQLCNQGYLIGRTWYPSRSVGSVDYEERT